MTRVLALADQSKIGCITQRRFAKVGTKTHPQRGADLDRNGLSVSTETACRSEPKSPVGNSEICNFSVKRMAVNTLFRSYLISIHRLWKILRNYVADAPSRRMARYTERTWATRVP